MKNEMKTTRFKPGDAVPESGVYRAEHKRHRLMHTATLAAASRFPRCQQCGEAVDYYLLRRVARGHVLPLRSGIFLQEYARPAASVRLSDDCRTRRGEAC
jgi:hypothetical protein